MSEFDLLQHVYSHNHALGPSILIPPGDDMGMLRAAAHTHILATVDQLIEGRHFERTTPLNLVGRKAIARSLSDVAAMAARPIGTLVAVTLPAEFRNEQALQLFEAMRDTAAAFNAPLFGGDIATHASANLPLCAAVTILAMPLDAAHAPRTRNAAQPGDRVYITGSVGGSLESGRHLSFTPRIDEAITLSQALGDQLHAMVDISDGLGRDASHVARMSHVTIEIDAASVPTHDDIPWLKAVAEGEDYELLFTAAPEAHVPPVINGVAVSCIGTVNARDAEEGGPFIIFIDKGKRIAGDSLGWEHGSQERAR
ncbi:MAG: thiamine-phosphate kinase [Phycisphaerales bacterium]